MPASAISPNTAVARRWYDSGVRCSAAAYICSRHVQNEPTPIWVAPRNNRWKAWLWALASPGSVRPARPVVAVDGGSVTPWCTAVMRSPSTSIVTPAATVSPPSHASSHQ